VRRWAWRPDEDVREAVDESELVGNLAALVRHLLLCVLELALGGSGLESDLQSSSDGGLTYSTVWTAYVDGRHFEGVLSGSEDVEGWLQCRVICRWSAVRV